VAGTMATIAEQLRREGEARGRQEGRQEGKQELVLKLLRARFGQVPDRLLDRVNAAAPEQLEHWAERILTAGSIEEVLDS
jgi:predicted transposase YdaD